MKFDINYSDIHFLDKGYITANNQLLPPYIEILYIENLITGQLQRKVFCTAKP